MSSDISELFNDIENDIKMLDETAEDNDFERYRMAELKLKYLMTVALKEIVINLHEISHFGIGTD